MHNEPDRAQADDVADGLEAMADMLQQRPLDGWSVVENEPQFKQGPLTIGGWEHLDLDAMEADAEQMSSKIIAARLKQAIAGERERRLNDSAPTHNESEHLLSNAA